MKAQETNFQDLYDQIIGTWPIDEDKEGIPSALMYSVYAIGSDQIGDIKSALGFGMACTAWLSRAPVWSDENERLTWMDGKEKPETLGHALWSLLLCTAIVPVNQCCDHFVDVQIQSLRNSTSQFRWWVLENLTEDQLQQIATTGDVLAKHLKGM